MRGIKAILCKAIRQELARERLRFVYALMPELAAMRDRRALLLSGGQ